MVENLRSVLENFKRENTSYHVVRAEWAQDYDTDNEFEPIIPKEILFHLDGPTKPSTQFSWESLPSPCNITQQALTAKEFEGVQEHGERMIEIANETLRRVL